MGKVNEVTIKVHIGRKSNSPIELHAPRGKKLIDLLKDNNISLQSPCFGGGICGKCRVRFIDGNARVTTADMRHISKEDLEEGYRLACMCMLVSDSEILVQEYNEDNIDVPKAPGFEARDAQKDKKYGIGIDIGTTTLAVALVELPCEDDNLPEKKILDVETGINHQRNYGIDVISRIKASKDNGERLQELVIADLEALIFELLKNTHCDDSQIESIAIAGNTTMLHLLRGYNCESLGVYPYTPVNINLETCLSKDIFPSLRKNIPVTILPGFTAFVGADILSGLYATRPWKRDGMFVFLDLGTNGEMVAGIGDKLYVTSTAAGPVFEGGGISCGIPGIPGAISKAFFTNGKLNITTIGDEAPIGICGTGVLEIVGALVKEGIVDETGLLCSDYFEKGYPVCKTKDGRDIVITQNDIRQVQMAKAAVNVGLIMIYEKLGSKTEDIKSFYEDSEKTTSFHKEQRPYVIISGGFGTRLCVERIGELKMFPKEITKNGDNIYIAGNTSLQGTARYLCMESVYGTKIAREELSMIQKRAKEIELSQDEGFSDKYYEAMNF